MHIFYHFFDEIKKIRYIRIEKKIVVFLFCRKSMEYSSDSEKIIYKKSAIAGIFMIFELEPLILEDGKDELELKIQSDSEGIQGDVRDILIIRRGIEWEIGLSVRAMFRSKT